VGGGGGGGDYIEEDEEGGKWEEFVAFLKKKDLGN